MQAVPGEFLIASSMVGLALGVFGAFATIRRGDLVRHRILHTVATDERRLPRNFKGARRKGVTTVLYAVRKRLKGRVIIAMPHAIHNPGRLPVKNISVLIHYPARYGVPNEELGEISADLGQGDPEFLKHRKGEITGRGSQVVLTIPVLRGGETWYLHDFIAVPSDSSGRIASQKDDPPVVERLSRLPGFRHFLEMEITIYSDATPARTREISVLLLDTGADEDVAELAEKVSDAVWASARPKPGPYIKYPWQRDPMTWELGVFIAPEFVPLHSKRGSIHIEAPSKAAFTSFIYHVPAVDYRRMPNNLTPEQMLNYLGLSPLFSSRTRNGLSPILGGLLRTLGRSRSLPGVFRDHGRRDGQSRRGNAKDDSPTAQ